MDLVGGGSGSAPAAVSTRRLEVWPSIGARIGEDSAADSLLMFGGAGFVMGAEAATRAASFARASSSLRRPTKAVAMASTASCEGASIGWGWRLVGRSGLGLLCWWSRGGARQAACPQHLPASSFRSSPPLPSRPPLSP